MPVRKPKQKTKMFSLSLPVQDVDGVKDRKVTEVLVEGGVNTDRIINITDEQTAVIQEITITIGPIT